MRILQRKRLGLDQSRHTVLLNTVGVLLAGGRRGWLEGDSMGEW